MAGAPGWYPPPAAGRWRPPPPAHKKGRPCEQAGGQRTGTPNHRISWAHILPHTTRTESRRFGQCNKAPSISGPCEYRVSCNGGSAQEPQERDFLPDRGATPGTSRRKTAPVSKLAWWEAPRKAKHGIRRKRNLDGDHLQIRLLHPRGGSNSAQRTRGRTCGHGGLRTDSRSSKGAPAAKPEPSEVHCAKGMLQGRLSLSTVMDDCANPVNFSKA